MGFGVKQGFNALTTKVADFIGDKKVQPSGGHTAPLASPPPTSGQRPHLNTHAGRGQFQSMAEGKNDPAKMTLQAAKDADLKYLSDTAPYGKAMERWKNFSFSQQLDGQTNREKIKHVMMLTRSTRPGRPADAMTALSSISTGTTGILSKMSTIPATILKWAKLDAGTKTDAQNVLIKEARDILDTKIPITPANPSSPVFTPAKNGEDPKPFLRERDENGNYQCYVRYSALGRKGTFGEIARFDKGAEEVMDSAWNRTKTLQEELKSISADKYSIENVKTNVQRKAKKIQTEANHLKHNAGKLFANGKNQFAGSDLKRMARGLFSTNSSKSGPPRDTAPPPSTGREKHQKIGVNQVSLEQLRTAHLSSNVQAYQGTHVDEYGSMRGFFKESKSEFEFGPVIDYCMKTPPEMQTVQGLFEYKIDNGYLNSAYKVVSNETEQPPYGVQLKDVQGNVEQTYKQALEIVQGKLGNEARSPS